MRLAVWGVPKSGTSLTVGLARILGFRLPAVGLTRCHVGEVTAGRLDGNDASALIPRTVHDIEPGAVWKDPCAGAYVDQLTLADDWIHVRVSRDPHDTWLSEHRHPHGAHLSEATITDRNRRWLDAIDRRVTPVLVLPFDLLRHDPVEAMRQLAAVTVGMDAVNPIAIRKVEAYVADGYGCPDVGDCSC